MPTTFHLIARSGPTAGNTYTLEEEEIFIGRDLNNNIVINDPEVSRRHLRFYRQGDTYVLEDLGSTNGTMVNGQRVTGTYTLRTGEEITLGEHVHLEFERVGDGHTDETLLSARAVEVDMDKTISPSAAKAANLQSDFYADIEADFPPEKEKPIAYAGQVPEQPVRVSEQPKTRRKLPTWAIIAIIFLLIIVCACSLTAWFMPAEWWCAIDVFGIFQGCPR